MSQPHFLPYQARWIKDKARVKIWEKSRRIGATYAQSYEDVEDVAGGIVPAVWFSSADESAAKEYILYCEKWARLFNVAAKQLGQEIIDEEKNIKALGIEFPGLDNRRIIAMSSNPKAFRSKGGKVVLDEFAHHADAKGLWTAAKPCITWGFPMRILSTHNSVTSRFNRFIRNIAAGKLDWSHHVTDIFRAVEEGLADRITGRPLSKAERDAWIEQERQSCDDPFTWEQEYCCLPVDETTAFLTYEKIGQVEHPCLVETIEDLEACIGDVYIGVDIGRKKDLTVFWVFERIGPLFFTRHIVVMEKTPFHMQMALAKRLFQLRQFRRACIDQTGIGMMMAEELQRFYGEFRVEKVTFTQKVKEDLAYHAYTMFDDKLVVTPPDQVIRDDLHSVKRITTSAGNARFDVASDETDGHADRFWAMCLALQAGRYSGGLLVVTSRGRRQGKTITKGY